MAAEKETQLLCDDAITATKGSQDSALVHGLRNTLSWLIFIPCEIFLIPVQVFLVLWVAYKQIWVSKQLGISQTAIEVFNGRWTMDAFNMKTDPLVRKLGYALENTSVTALWWFLFPFWIKYKIGGGYSMYPVIPKPGYESYKDLITARTTYFDEMIERILPQVEQFVLLGAGYDCRPYDFCHRGVKVFEIDQEVVQKHKIKTLKLANIDHDGVKFLTVDFTKERMIDVLMQNGFDSTQKSLILMEGVTLYLSEKDVRDTMKQIRDNTACGSVFLCDFYGLSFVEFSNKGVSKEILKSTGELIEFGLRFNNNDWKETMQDFIKSEGLIPGQLSFMGYNNEDGPWHCVAESIIK